MADDAETEFALLDRALLEVGLALEPLAAVDSPEKATALMKLLGYELPGTQVFDGVPAPLMGKVGAIGEDLQALVVSESEAGRLAALLALAAKIADVSGEIGRMIANMQAAQGSLAAFVAAAPVDQLPRRLLDLVVSEYVETFHASAYHALLLLGVFDEIETAADAPTFQPAFTLRKVWWERLPRYVDDPAGLSEEIYRWQSDFDSALFLTRLERLLRGFLLPGGIYDQNPTTAGGLGNAPASKEIRIPIFQAGLTPEIYSELGVSISGADAAGSKPKGLALIPYAVGVAEMPFTLDEDWDVVLELGAALDNGVGIILRPLASLELITNLFTAPAAAGDLSLKLSLKQKPDRRKETFVFGSAKSSHLSLKGIELDVFFRKKDDDLDFGVELAVREGKVVIGVEGADGFIEKVLSGVHMEAGFEVGVGATAKGGVYFRGSGGLEVRIPLHLTLGPLRLDQLLLKLQPVDGTFPLVVAATLGLDLGPLHAVVENVGVEVTLSFPDGGGNLGPAHFALGFHPPNGVGLSLDTGAVKAGGYLFFDPEKGEYAGALELSIANLVNAKAIGIITTKMPDGSPGFSLLIIITAEFLPAFQLGYGFTLIGVGGLLGLNRTMRLEPLREGVRTGAVNSIMFPQNVVENAPRIISDLKSIFPPADGIFLIGPMAKLGWGTPTLVSLSLGLIIEIPGNIAILGVLRVALPTEELALTNIQVNFVGTIDFGKRLLSFDAALFDSRLLTMTLEGDMAVRFSWGDQPDLLATVGGFHPSYTPPPLALPSLKRLALSILDTPAARIRVEAYLAVTTNTVQLGARAELFFGFSEMSLEGTLGFDALLRRSPFYFIVEVRAGVTLRVIGIDTFSLRLKFTLEGPTPWRAKGKGSISLFFFDIDVDFDKTWGEERNTRLPPIEVLPTWLEEIGRRESWKAVLPATGDLLVTLRKLDEAAELLVLHPAGAFVVAQKMLPLGLTLDRVGSQVPSDVRKIAITRARSGTEELELDDELDSFAPAQFKDMDDAARLSSPAFQKMPAGVRIRSGAGLAVGDLVKRKLEYELTVIDKEPQQPLPRGKFHGIPGALVDRFLCGNATARSPLSQATKAGVQPFADKVKTAEERYAVVWSDTNRVAGPGAVFGSQAQAKEYLAGLAGADPRQAEKLQVIPSCEVNAS
jgi:hypothetical protein